MRKNIITCGKGLLWALKNSIPINGKIKITNKGKIINKPEVKSEDIIVLVDGSKSRSLIPKTILDTYNKNGETLDFESVYSIKGIIIYANNIEDAVKQYLEIKSNLLEDE